MKVLWITHDVLDVFYPLVKGKPSKGGSWISPLFYTLAKDESIKLAILTPIIDGEMQNQCIDGITYYTLPIKKGGNTVPMSRNVIDNYHMVISDFKPDIIHVHGVEKNFGLIREYIDKSIPIVCSIQGIITSYFKYYIESISNLNLSKYRSLKNVLRKGGTPAQLRDWTRYGSIERKIFRINEYFIGRTTWDKAQLKELNSKANYYHGEELLRADFNKQAWSIDTCKKHQIFMSSASYPIKGFHVLLEAIRILKNRYKAIHVTVPLAMGSLKYTKLKSLLIGDDYSRYLQCEIKRLGLQSNITLLGRLDASEMALAYKNAHVFVLSSFVENSPNALGEAMMVGVPTVASFVGGVPSIVSDNNSALLFPSGDAALLAYQIERVFENDDLAISLSQEAQLVAHKRHNTEFEAERYVSIYEDIIKQHKVSEIL